MMKGKQRMGSRRIGTSTSKGEKLEYSLHSKGVIGIFAIQRIHDLA